MTLAYSGGCLPASGPRTPGETVELGPVFASKTPKIRHRFTVTNTTGRAVRILGKATSCTCTTSVLGSDTLGTGESTTLDLELNTPGGYADRPIFANLKTDHPDFSTWEYKLHFIAYPGFRVDPEQVDFGVLTRPFKTDVRSMQVEFYAPLNEEPDSLSTIESDPELAVERDGPPMIDQPHPLVRRVGQRLRVSLRKEELSAQTGSIVRSFTLKTLKGDVCQGTVAWRLEEAIKCAPSHVHFGMLDSETNPAESTVLVSRHDKQPFRVLGVEVGDGITADLEKEETQSTARPIHLLKLRLKQPKKSDQSILEGTIRVLTDQDDCQVVPIYWSAFVRRSGGAFPK